MISYKTITKSHHKHIPPIKGSKFEGYIFHAENQQEVRDVIDKIRQIHPKATHICYANSVGLQIQQDMFGQVMVHSDRDYSNDDGEPSGTAGRPILQVLQGAELRNVGCAVVRYFGGTMLGVGGLVKAYTQTTQAVVESAKILQTPLLRDLVLRVDGIIFHQVMNWKEQCKYQSSLEYSGSDVVISLQIPRGDYEEVVAHCDLQGWKRVS